jgi:L-fucono-1,5-lactonase
MIIDAHHHLWDTSRGYSWLDVLPVINRTFTTADLRETLAANGIRHSLLVEAGRCDPAEATEFLALADQTPEIAGVVAWCDLANPQLPAHGLLKGARSQIQAETDPGYLSRPDVRQGLRTIAERHLTYDLVVRVDQLRACAEAAAATPSLTFVLDHLGKPSIRDGAAGLAAWRRAITPLAELPNVYAKLSGLVTEADWNDWRPSDLFPFVDTALELFGPQRLMFGSDWPVCLLAASYERVLDALTTNLTSLAPAERDEIFSGTAIRAYRLTL